MTAQDSGVAVTLTVVGLCYSAVLVAIFRYAAARTPAGIVRRLYRTGRPVTVAVTWLSSGAWDPAHPTAYSNFYAPGRVTYTLEGPGTIRAIFQPKSRGTRVERSAAIPPSLLPDSPATRRRRWAARAVIGVYALLGVATFALTAALVDGTRTFRIRTGAVVALGVVAIAWLVMHLVLTARRHRAASPSARGGVKLSHHLLGWIAAYVVVAAALGVAWRLSNLDQPHPMSWATSFLSAALFVLAGGGAVTASLHHHTYVHHPPDPEHPDRPR